MHLTRKTLIILVILLLLFWALALVLFLRSSPSQTSYTTDYFKVRYPNSWDKTTRLVAGAGTMVTLLPHDLKPDTLFPRIDIIVTPLTAENSLKKKIESLSFMELKQQNTVFHDIPVIELSSTKISKLLHGNPEEKPIKKTILLFERTGFLYDIDYALFQDQDQVSVERELKGILSSIDIK